MSLPQVSWLPLLTRLFLDAQGKPIQLESKDSAVVIPKDVDTTLPLHALIFGINKFKYHGDLKGAVNDAEAFEKYLREVLKATDVTVRKDEEATREQIIKDIRALGDKNFEKDEAIVIFFAGHGAEVMPPPDRRVNGPLVQCIIPHDAASSKSVLLTTEGSIIPPIPDFTIGALMDELCRKKGDNITLIFDCCHSGGGSRDAEDGARFVPEKDLPPLPSKLDSDIVGIPGEPGAGESNQPTGFPSQAMKSHVLLAGCRSSELSYEDSSVQPPQGNFTGALLKQLRKRNACNLTYKGCMEQFPQLSSNGKPQHPVCEGDNVGRLFFNGKVTPVENLFIPIKYQEHKNYESINPEPGVKKYYLDAGSAHGITPGSIFEIYEHANLNESNKLLAKAIVSKIQAFDAELLELLENESTAPLQLPFEFTYGLQVGYGQEQALDVYFEPQMLKAAQPDIWWTKAFSGTDENVVLRPAEQPIAQLTVGLTEDGRANFTIADQVAVKHGAHKLHKTVKLNPLEVMTVMRAAARWNWHLRRTPEAHALRGKLEVKFYKLVEVGDDGIGGAVWGPTPENLIKDGVVEITIGSGKEVYGMEVINNTQTTDWMKPGTGRDFYVYPFYFSASEQSIESKYTPIYGSSDIDPNLPADKTPFTSDATEQKVNRAAFGYGSSGVKPLTHSLQPGQDVDVGVYKFFVTNDAATSFSSIVQESPFTILEANRREAEDKLAYNRKRDPPVWDTLDFTVVIRRSKSEGSGNSLDRSHGADSPLPIRVESERRSGGYNASSNSNVRPASVELLKTEPLSAEVIAKAVGLKLHVCSKETKGIPGKKNGAWFALALVDSEGNTRPDPDDEEGEKELVWRSHINDKVGRYGAECTWATGEFKKDTPLWKYAQVGDMIQARVEARGGSWANYATRGVLEIY